METNQLRKELLEKRKSVSTSELKMSVGELISLYNDNEINLEPAFQRLFRWSEIQETTFIESLLLGYPIPPIFVMQREDGVWDVIDGVQRLSTIYHFNGVLKDKDNNLIEPLILKEGEILKELKNMCFKPGFYENKPDIRHLDSATRIDFKRVPLSILILKHESDPDSKYNLFKRLNTGGSHLSAAEIRNAIILMYDENTYNKISDYANKNDTFKTLINLPESQIEIRTDMDIIIRFLVLKNIDDTELTNLNHSENLDLILDKGIINLLASEDFDIDKELHELKLFISFLSNNLQEDYGFRKYDKDKHRFVLAFNYFIFETLIFGLTKVNNITDINNLNGDKLENIINIIKSLETISDYGKRTSQGKNPRVVQRIKIANEEALRIFRNVL